MMGKTTFNIAAQSFDSFHDCNDAERCRGSLEHLSLVLMQAMHTIMIIARADRAC
jgi:hypothetical protein